MSNKKVYILEANGCLCNERTEYSEKKEAVKRLAANFNEAMKNHNFDSEDSHLYVDEGYLYSAERGEAQIWYIYSQNVAESRNEEILNSIESEVYRARAKELTELDNPCPCIDNLENILHHLKELRSQH